MQGDIQLELRKFLAPEYVFGINARMKVGNYCSRLGGRKVLVVTDATLKALTWLKDVLQSLANAGMDAGVYAGVSPNPRDFEVMQGAELYRQHKCNMIVALGGGSVIDCAKGIGIVSTNHKNIGEFEGVDRIDKPMPPLICIPSTCGSAADVSQFAIITNSKEKYKMAIISKAVVPDVSLIDPVILTSMDSFLTACTGMDALSHAFESFVSNASSAFTDLYALEAIWLIHDNLLNAVEHPDDLQCKGKAMLGSLYAGLAFSNASLGCVHSMAHSLGGYLDVPHGECNSILLPHVVEFNFSMASYRYKKIAEVLNVEISGVGETKVKNALNSCLIDFTAKLGLNKTLSHLGVRYDMIPMLASKSIKDPCNATNPRPPQKRDLETIFEEAM